MWAEDYKKASSDIYEEVYRDLASHFEDMDEHFMEISVESTLDWIYTYYNNHTFTSRKLNYNLSFDEEATFEIIKFVVDYYRNCYNMTYRMTTFSKCLDIFASLCAKEIFKEVFETEYGCDMKTREEIAAELESESVSEDEIPPQQ